MVLVSVSFKLKILHRSFMKPQLKTILKEFKRHVKQSIVLTQKLENNWIFPLEFLELIIQSHSCLLKTSYRKDTQKKN